MDGSRDLNNSGNKIINVADPTELQDVATKCYTDHTHFLRPTSNVYEYLEYINKRNVLLHSIAGLVKVSTDIEYTFGKHTGGHPGNPYVWLESPTSTLEVLLKKAKHLTGKYIAIRYSYPIVVNTWYFNIARDVYEDWEVQFRWEVSSDGVFWVPLPVNRTARTTKSNWCGNNTVLRLQNEWHTRSTYWRIVFIEGVTNQNCIYINYLRMEVST